MFMMHNAQCSVQLMLFLIKKRITNCLISWLCFFFFLNHVLIIHCDEMHSVLFKGCGVTAKMESKFLNIIND